MATYLQWKHSIHLQQNSQLILVPLDMLLMSTILSTHFNSQPSVSLTKDSEPAEKVQWYRVVDQWVMDSLALARLIT